jgi:ABC-2 type transport system ATP-binding protein
MDRSPPHAIRTEMLSRHFGPVRALDDLTFEVPAGKVFGFLGPNGSGKTTTIRLLLGLLRPTTGRVEVLGLDAGTRSSEIRERVGVLLEHHGLYEQMSAWDNLDFWARAWRMGGKDRAARIQELLEHFSLWGRRQDRVGLWSHGMKKRLALARALLPRPQLLLLDEPTAGLDVTSGAAVRKDLADLASRGGVTVFMSTHNMTEAEQLCDCVAVIRAGKLLAVDSPDILRAQTGSHRVEILGRGFSSDLVRQVESQSYVSRVTAHDTKLSVELRDTNDPAPLVALLVTEGASIEEVHRGAASLEEVFLSLMEEAAEEEDADADEVDAGPEEDG